jgi:hypothetical protein
MTAEGLDKCALPDAGRAGDANPDRPGARLLLELAENLLRHFLVRRGIAFDERDGARKQRPVSAEDTSHVIVNRKFSGTDQASLLLSSVRIFCAAIGITVPGPKIAAAPLA